MIRAVRFRLLGYITGVLVLVLLAAGTLVYVLLTRELDEALDDHLRALALPPFGGLSEQAESLPAGVFIVRTVGNRELSRSPSTPAGLPDPASLGLARPVATDLRTVTIEGQRYRVLTTSIQGGGRGPGGPGGPGGGGPGGGPGGGGFVQQVGVSLEEREQQQWVVRLALAGGGGLGVALTALGAFFLTGRALAPVAASMARQRRFVSDASHELRTPLALLRLEIEGQRAIEPQQRGPLLQQVDRLARMVGDMLLLARLDEGELPLEREPVAIDGLLRTAADEARRLAPEARVAIEGASDLWVSGDADRLHQALLVLIDNACRVTPPGGAITLRARLDGGAVVLSVSDEGPGVPPEHAAQVFERFYRADKGRARAQGGAGLGLSIASDIVRRHGGALRLEPSGAPGTRGATFSISLPRLDAATVAALAPAAE